MLKKSSKFKQEKDICSMSTKFLMRREFPRLQLQLKKNSLETDFKNILCLTKLFRMMNQ